MPYSNHITLNSAYDFEPMMSLSSTRTRRKRFSYSFRRRTTPNIGENAPKMLEIRQSTGPTRAKRCSERSEQETPRITRAQLRPNTPNSANDNDNKGTLTHISNHGCRPNSVKRARGILSQLKTRGSSSLPARKCSQIPRRVLNKRNHLCPISTKISEKAAQIRKPTSKTQLQIASCLLPQGRPKCMNSPAKMHSISDTVKLNARRSRSDRYSMTATPAGRSIKTKLLHSKSSLPEIALENVKSPEELKPFLISECTTGINGSKNNISKETVHISITNEQKSCQQMSIEQRTSDENESDIEYEVEEVDVGPRPPPMYILPKWIKIPVEVHVEKMHDVSKIIALDREGAYVMKESPFTEPRYHKRGKRKTTNETVNRPDAIPKRRFKRIAGGFTNLQPMLQPALEELGDEMVHKICLKISLRTLESSEQSQSNEPAQNSESSPNVVHVEANETYQISDVAESAHCSTMIFAPLSQESAVVHWSVPSRLTENATAAFRCCTSRSRKQKCSNSPSDAEEESNRRVAEIVNAIKSQARVRELAAAKPEKERKRGHSADGKLQHQAKKWPKNRHASVHSCSSLESSEQSQSNEPAQNSEIIRSTMEHAEPNETSQIQNVAESAHCSTMIFAPLSQESAVVHLTVPSRLTENVIATFRRCTSRSRKQICSKSVSDVEEESDKRVAEIVNAIKSQARVRELAAAKPEKERKRGHSADAKLQHQAKKWPKNRHASVHSCSSLESSEQSQSNEPAQNSEITPNMEHAEPNETSQIQNVIIESGQIFETSLNMEIMESNVPAEISSSNNQVNTPIGTAVDDTMESDVRQLEPGPISHPRESPFSNSATDEYAADDGQEQEAIQNTIGSEHEENSSNAITNGVATTPVVKEEPMSEDDYVDDEEYYDEDGEWEFVTDDEDETVDIKPNISRTCDTALLDDACSQINDHQPAKEGSVSAPVAIPDLSQNVPEQEESSSAENCLVSSNIDQHSLESIPEPNGTRMDSSMDSSISSLKVAIT
ncbi:hypothetical protein Ddc_12432 [Ditylenchus destructor]|nr:hypothetical protein Ddc_12432 [Ditylenchus destructor]